MGEEQYLIGNFLNGIPWVLYIRLSHRVSFPGGFSIWRIHSYIQALGFMDAFYGMFDR